jgi:hypothetical protein
MMQTFKLISPGTGQIVRMTVTGQVQVWKTARYSFDEGRPIVRDYAPLLLRRHAEKALGESLESVAVD